jgi:photosynthetic reaction center cytochrome c subunit
MYTITNMKRICLMALASFYVVSAQTPNFSGVWKADLQKSKMVGQPATSYLVIIEQDPTKITEKVGLTTQRGEQRMAFNYNLAKPSMNSFRGIPMRTESSMNGNTLVLTSKIAGNPPGTMTERYTLSPDGNTLTIESVAMVNGKEQPQTIVLEKQPDSAGEPLRQPEKTAGESHKNVQLLKDMPNSQFMDTMRYFTVALGNDCNFCHVQGNFAADDKPQKVMARKMLTMTHEINAANFNGRMEVRCYTCHKGMGHPQSNPSLQ